MKQIRTAIVPIGGLGTRFYPVTKTLSKCLLPVYNRPVIDYIIDNCLAAGLTRLLLIPIGTGSQAIHYLKEDSGLKQALTEVGKEKMYSELIEPLHARIETAIIEQPANSERGTAAAISWARPFLPADEPFVVMMGDNFLWRGDGGSDLLDMINSFQQSGAVAACLVEKVKTFEQLKPNAAVKPRAASDGRHYLETIIEKPQTDVKPRLANVGRYIFNPSVFDIVEQQAPDPRFGETVLTDTLQMLSEHQPVLVHTMQGRQLDCGTPDHWLTTNNFIARHRNEALAAPAAATTV